MLFLHLVSELVIMIVITYNDNDALIENISVTESNPHLAKNLLEDTLESKSNSHDHDENILFPFLKKIKSEHPKNLIGQLNVDSIRNKFESVQEIIQNTFLFVKLKLIPPSQINSFVYLNIVYFERIIMHVVEDYFSM